MPARCLNKVILIGNLTRDPELRYTPSGSAVCSFGLATNRYWTTESGERKEDAQFHRIVAWTKLAEICSQLLGKGDKVYLEGRLQTRRWTGSDGVERKTTEIIISDMILLRSRRGKDEEGVPGLDEPKGEDEGIVKEGEKEEKKKEVKKATVDKTKKVKKVEEKEGDKGEEEKKKEGEKKEKEKEEREEKVEIPEDKTPF